MTDFLQGLCCGIGAGLLAALGLVALGVWLSRQMLARDARKAEGEIRGI